MMKKYISLFLIVFVTFFVCTSCEDNGKDEYLDEYESTLYFLKSGEIDLDLYKTGKNTEYTAVIYKAGHNSKVSVTATVQLMTNEELQAYNSENETHYVLLPETHYDIDKMNFNLGSDVLNQMMNISFKTDLIHQLPEADYVLPMMLMSDSKVNEKKNHIFLKPTVVIPNIYFEEDGLKEVSVADDEEKEVTVKSYLTMPIDNKWDFECVVHVNEQLLADYNNENGTDYKLLSSHSYTMEGTVPFTSGKEKAPIDITIDKSKLSYGSYMIPLEITSCSQPGFVINEEKKTQLLLVTYTPQVIELTANMLSSNAVEPNEGALKNILDDDVSTFFHSTYSSDIGETHYLQITLNEAVSSFQFKYTTRKENGNAAPKTIDVFASTDGTDFTKITTLSDGLPQNGSEEYTSPTIKPTNPIMYIRLSIPENYTGGKFFVMSKFSLFGK